MDRQVIELMLSKADVGRIIEAAVDPEVIYTTGGPADTTMGEAMKDIAPSEEVDIDLSKYRRKVHPDRGKYVKTLDDEGSIIDNLEKTPIDDEKKAIDALEAYIGQEVERDGDFAKLLREDKRKAADAVAQFIDHVNDRDIFPFKLNSSAIAGRLVKNLIEVYDITYQTEPTEEVKQHESKRSAFIARLTSKERVDPLSQQELWDLFSYIPGQDINKDTVAGNVSFFLGRETDEETGEKQRFRNKWVKDLIRREKEAHPEKEEDEILIDYLTRFYGYIKNVYLSRGNKKEELDSIQGKIKELLNEMVASREDKNKVRTLNSTLNELHAKYKELADRDVPDDHMNADDVEEHKSEALKRIETHILSMVLRKDSRGLRSALEGTRAFTEDQIYDFEKGLSKLKVKYVGEALESFGPMTKAVSHERYQRMNNLVNAVVGRAREEIKSKIVPSEVEKAIIGGTFDKYVEGLKFISEESSETKAITKVTLREKASRIHKLLRRESDPKKRIPATYGEQPEEVKNALRKVLKGIKKFVDAHNKKVLDYYKQEQKKRPALDFPHGHELDYRERARQVISLVLRYGPYDFGTGDAEAEGKSRADAVRKFLTDDLKMTDMREVDRLVRRVGALRITTKERPLTKVDEKTGKPIPPRIYPVEEQPEDIQMKILELTEDLRRVADQQFTGADEATLKKALLSGNIERTEAILDKKGISINTVKEEYNRALGEVSTMAMSTQPVEVKRYVDSITDHLSYEAFEPELLKRDYGWIASIPIRRMAEIDVQNSKTPYEYPHRGIDVYSARADLFHLERALNSFLRDLAQPELSKEIADFQGFVTDEKMKVNQDQLMRKLTRLVTELKNTPLTPEEQQKLVRIDAKDFEIRLGIEPGHLASVERTLGDTFRQTGKLISQNMVLLAKRQFGNDKDALVAVDAFARIAGANGYVNPADAKRGIMSEWKNMLVKWSSHNTQLMFQTFRAFFDPRKLYGSGNKIENPSIKEAWVKFLKDPMSLYDYLIGPGREYRNPDPAIDWGSPTQKILKQLKPVVESMPVTWEKVEHVYDWVDKNLDYSKIPSVIVLSDSSAAYLKDAFELMDKTSKEHAFLDSIVQDPVHYHTLIEAYTDLYDLFKDKNYDFKVMMSSGTNEHIYEVIDKWREFSSGLNYHLDKENFATLWNSKSPKGYMWEVEGQRIHRGEGEKIDLLKDSPKLEAREDFLKLAADPVILFLSDKIKDMMTPGGKAFGPRLEDVQESIQKRVESINRFINEKFDPNRIYSKNRDKLFNQLLALQKKIEKGESLTPSEGKVVFKKTARTLLDVRNSLIDFAVRLAAMKLFRKQRDIPEAFYYGQHLVKTPEGTAAKVPGKEFFFRPDAVDGFVASMEFYGMDFVDDLAKADEKVSPEEFHEKLDMAVVTSLANEVKNVKRFHLSDDKLKDESYRARVLQEGLMYRASEIKADQLVEAGKASPELKRDIDDALRARARLTELIPQYNGMLLKNVGPLKELDELARIILNPHSYVKDIVRDARDSEELMRLEQFLADTSLTPDERRYFEKKERQFKSLLSPLKNREKYVRFIHKLTQDVLSKKPLTDQEYKAIRESMHAGQAEIETLHAKITEEAINTAELSRHLRIDIEDERKRLFEEAKKDPFLKTRRTPADADFYRRFSEEVEKSLNDELRHLKATYTYLNSGIISEAEIGIRRDQLDTVVDYFRKGFGELAQVKKMLAELESPAEDHMKKVWEELKPFVNAVIVSDEIVEQWKSKMKPYVDKVTNARDDASKETAKIELQKSREGLNDEMQRYRGMINTMDARLQGIKRKIRDITWPDEPRRKKINVWIQAADDNIQRNVDKFEIVNDYIDTADSSELFPKIKAFLKEFWMKYRARGPVEVLDPKDLRDAQIKISRYLKAVDSELSEEVRAGRSGEETRPLQDMRQELLEAFGIMRDLAPYVPKSTYTPYRGTEGMPGFVEQTLGNATPYILSADPVKTFQDALRREYESYLASYAKYQRLLHEGYDKTTKLEDPSVAYANDLQKAHDMLNGLSTSIETIKNEANRLTVEKEKTHYEEMVETFKKYLPGMQTVLKYFENEYKRHISGSAPKAKVALWMETAAEDETFEKPKTPHDIITLRAPAKPDEELLEPEAKIHKIEIMEAVVRDASKHYMGMAELYDYMQTHGKAVDVRQLLKNLMAHLGRRIRNAQKYVDLVIPTAYNGDVKLKEIGRLFNDKLNAHLEKLSYVRAQISINQKMISRIEGKLREYQDFFVSVDFDPAEEGVGLGQPRGRDVFLGWTNAEKKSMTKVMYANLFWDLQRHWNTGVGREHVFGERYRPPFAKVYNAFKNFTDKVVKSSGMMQESLREIDKILRAPFDEVNFRREKERLLDQKKKMEQAYERLGISVVRAPLTTKDPDTLRKQYSQMMMDKRKLEEQAHKGDKKALPTLVQLKNDIRMFEAQYPDIVKGKKIEPELRTNPEYQLILKKLEYIESQEYMRAVILKKVQEIEEYPVRIEALKYIKRRIQEGDKLPGKEGETKQYDYDEGTIREIDSVIADFEKKEEDRKKTAVNTIKEFLKGPAVDAAAEKRKELEELSKKYLTPTPSDTTLAPGEKIAEQMSYRESSDFNPNILYGKILQAKISEMALSGEAL